MKKIADKIRKIRSDSNLTLREFASMISVTHSSISQWERGFSEPKSKHLIKISKCFDVSLEWLTDGALSSSTGQSTLDGFGCLVPYFPDLSVISLSGGVLNSELQSVINIPNNVLFNKKADDIYCLQISGNSMEPLIPNGAIVGVDRSDTKIVDGKVYVLKKQDFVTVKFVIRQPDGVLVKSCNNFYADKFYSIKEFKGFEVLGRVFWISLEI